MFLRRLLQVVLAFFHSFFCFRKMVQNQINGNLKKNLINVIVYVFI